MGVDDLQIYHRGVVRRQRTTNLSETLIDKSIMSLRILRRHSGAVETSVREIFDVILAGAFGFDDDAPSFFPEAPLRLHELRSHFVSTPSPPPFDLRHHDPQCDTRSARLSLSRASPHLSNTSVSLLPSVVGQAVNESRRLYGQDIAAYPLPFASLPVLPEVPSQPIE